jgi:hypothetical protein
VTGVPSPASDAVIAHTHPAPERGGPCGTCAFRAGTEANQTWHTMEMARLCVEGLVPFYCHEQPQVCRGFVAAVNLRGVPETEDDKRWAEVNRLAAGLMADAIAAGKRADEEAAARR